MNKFIPMVLSVALLGGSMAMAAPSHVSKTNRSTAIKKMVKRVATKKSGKSVITKK